MEMKTCFLCGRNGYSDRLEKHHIFGGPNRNLSDKYGLVVWLCGDRCHRNGKQSAHQSSSTRLMLHKYGQMKWMRENNGTIEDFRSLFGKNYLEGKEE